EQNQAKKEEQKKYELPKREKKWHEKFHWFISSEGFLCIGGRDATSNEIVVKKHTDKDDLIFHTEAAGSPFFIIKTQGKKIGEKTIQETAQATVTYSRAWKMGLVTTDVYWVTPAQVSKQTESGEYASHGAFVIRGKKNNVKTSIELAIGLTKEGVIMGGPPTAVQKHCQKQVLIVQGNEKTSDTAKKIQKIIGGDLNDIISALPGGGCALKKV
ncbi:DUF814 domain-containing protein, partial [Candidatus Woesearchaeota archaeon]|nr:DUF814 domain-containing protein [Candidatus Woesearchaeota archaeon]